MSADGPGGPWKNHRIIPPAPPLPERPTPPTRHGFEALVVLVMVLTLAAFLVAMWLGWL